MASCIMLQGTASHVGKSILTTALCRIFLQKGRHVVPFKAQNMSLNSYVTIDGKEMGRAQVAQAEAAGLLPDVDMNPVLLKPTGNATSQVIIHGLARGIMSARDYHKKYALHAFSAVQDSLLRLQAAFDTIVIEGAGSPAEVNLKDQDIVNMRVAKYLQAPVLLIADIDRGGALASIVGTLELLEPDERALIQGLIINKFRGDVSLFTPAIDFLEQKTNKPVLGVIPFLENLGIEEEDSVSLEDVSLCPKADKHIHIAVIRLPKISNFTDFSAFSIEPDVQVFYTQEAAHLFQADLIIIPGSKNTAEDLQWLHRHRLDIALQQALAKQIPIIGICGGYQMLGEKIVDPKRTESEVGCIDGLGILPITTTFCKQKKIAQVRGICRSFPFLEKALPQQCVQGYEIHHGQSYTDKFDATLITLDLQQTQKPYIVGMARADGMVWGTYLHGIFDEDGFRRNLLNELRQRKGFMRLPLTRSYRVEKERAYDRLAMHVRTYLQMDKIYRIMAGGM